MKETKTRNPALDYTKGVLVIGMLLFHATYFFIADDSVRNVVAGRLLSFISGSWVFISGLIVTHYYENKFSKDRFLTSKRLWVRGIKILLLFVILNIIISLLGLSQSTKILSISGLIYILLNGDAVNTSFEILIGISYVLLLSPIYLLLGRWGTILSIGLLLVASVAAIKGHDIPPIAWIILCGIGGMVAGKFVTYVTVNHKSLVRYSARMMMISCASTLFYFYLTFAFGFDKGDMYTYLYGIASILLMIYLSYHWVSEISSIDRYLRFLGRYSLIAYIGQMGILWAMVESIGATVTDIPFVVSFSSALILMSLGIMLVDYARGRLPIIRRLYGLIFA